MVEFSPSIFEEQVRAALRAAPIRAQFHAQLRAQLAAAARRQRPARPQMARSPRRLWAAGLAGLLLVAVLAAGPQRVLAQVLGWFGYVPGIGFVDSSVGLRVLKAPVVQTRGNVTVTVQDGLVDAEHTWLTIFVEGIQQDQIPVGEGDPGCPAAIQLWLPGATAPLNMTRSAGSGGRTWSQLQLQYLALPVGASEALLRFDCVPGLKEGSGPRDWQLPLQFILAPEDYKALPVTPLYTPEGEAPSSSTANLHGIELRAENFVELPDGYLFHGQLDFSASQHTILSFSEFDLKFSDANGLPIAVESNYNETVPGNDAFVHHWSVRTNRKDIAGPITITLPQVSVDQVVPESPGTSLQFDFGPAPRPGQTWQLDQSFAIGEGMLHLLDATFESRPDGNYFLTLNMRLEGSLTSAAFVDLDNTSQLDFGGGGGGGGGGSASNLYQSIGYTYVPTGVHRLAIGFVTVVQPGPWVIQVELPQSASSAPFPIEACLAQDLSLSTPSAVPFVEIDRLLVEGTFREGVYFPSLFVTDPFGAQSTELTPGGWGALSADGQQVAYTDGDGLHVIEVSSLQDRLLSAAASSYSPVWAPGGEQLAFIKGGDGIWLIDARGGNERRLPNTHADMIRIAGWLPDGQHLIAVANTAAGSQVQQVHAETGTTEDLFLIDNRKGGFAVLAPDGERIAYSSELFGSIHYGLYASRLDRSQQRLIAQPGDHALFMAGAWSPDGRWLLVNQRDPMQSTPALQPPILVNVETCQASLVDGVLGNVVGWAAGAP